MPVVGAEGSRRWHPFRTADAATRNSRPVRPMLHQVEKLPVFGEPGEEREMEYLADRQGEDRVAASMERIEAAFGTEARRTEPAMERVERAVAAGLPGGQAVADSAYGVHADFRRVLPGEGLT